MAQQGTIAREYVAKMPHCTPTEIAGLIMDEHPGLFACGESARSRVRYYMGKNGAKNRTQCAEGSLLPVLPSEVRILNMDIETAPMLAFVWGCFKQFVNPDQLLEPSQVICWAAKWLGDDTMMFDGMQKDIKRSENVLDFYQYSDERVVRGMWELFNEADIIVGHNGQAFDTKTLNARWIKHGLPPPSPYRFVDTLSMVKDTTRLPRNKLESVGRYYGIGQKLEHEGFGLWVKCMCGDKEAWAKMRSYNEQDVLLDEKAYMLYRPWATRHPNVALHYQDGARRCIVCGSTAVVEDTAHQAHTNASVFPSYRCESCGKVMRGRKRLDPTAAIEDRLTHAM